MNLLLPDGGFHEPLNRRQMLRRFANGFGMLGLAGLLSDDFIGCVLAEGKANPLTVRPPPSPAKAKRVIFLFMSGGPSHVDTFDPKPRLAEDNGKPLPFEKPKLERTKTGNILASPYTFKKHGESGTAISELFPRLATCVDDLCIVRSMVADNINHNGACLQMNTGEQAFSRPSLGSWLLYGLGSENQNLPGFVVIYDKRGGPFSGPANWSAGFLPAAYQGTVFRATGDPILDLSPPADYVTPEQERARLDQLNWMNQNHAEQHPGSSELAARIASYELAYRMQMCAPETVDITKESDETRRLYGLDHPVTAPFGKQCLLARRLVERGVRFIQLYNGSIVNQNVDTWDAHASIVDNHGMHAAEVDEPIAGLITDLKQRGLLDETLVMWHSEFGRMPISQRGVGRDHNPGAMTVFLAGAGIKGGQKIGATDEVGYKATEQVVTPHDLHATLMYLLGLDHKRVTYYFNGRHMRLTDVAGELIPQIVRA